MCLDKIIQDLPDTETQAYFKWLNAGEPHDAGDRFWHEAEAEDNEWKDGWKVFNLIDNYYHFPFYAAAGQALTYFTDPASSGTRSEWLSNQGNPVPMGEVLKAVRKLVHTNNYDRKYETGFHLFLKKEDAEQYLPGTDFAKPLQNPVAVPIKYRKVRYLGLQEKCACVVALEILIEMPHYKEC